MKNPESGLASMADAPAATPKKAIASAPKDLSFMDKSKAKPKEYASADEVRAAVKAGTLDRQTAIDILKTRFKMP